MKLSVCIQDPPVRTKSWVRIYYDDDDCKDGDDVAVVVCVCFGQGLGKSHGCLYPEGKEYQALDSAKWIFGDREYAIWSTVGLN